MAPVAGAITTKPARVLRMVSWLPALIAISMMCSGCGEKPTCQAKVQSPLRWGCDWDTADYICCNNTAYAEYSGYFQSVGLFDKLDRTKLTTFFDSTCGVPLFRAPQGRSFEDWKAESEHHGWPSFREQELVNGDNGKPNVVFERGGEMRSVCGTHLGHNIPDSKPRYCIDLVCIAGKPHTGMSSLYQKLKFKVEYA